MARPQAPDFPERRGRIVDRAAQLFATRGFAETSVADLAAACAASKSLIYHYFDSKEDILYEVMRSHIDELVDDAARAVAGGGSAETRLRQLVHRFMAHYVGAADRQKVLLNELDSLPAERRSEIVAKQRSIVVTVSALLAEIEPELADDPARLRVRAMLLFGMINWTHTWFDAAGPVGAAEVAEMALGLLLRPGRVPRQAS